MANKFDNFSKHLATKQTRRGALKFLGASVIGATLGAFFTRGADADWFSRDIVLNGTSSGRRRWFSRGGDEKVIFPN